MAPIVRGSLQTAAKAGASAALFGFCVPRFRLLKSPHGPAPWSWRNRSPPLFPVTFRGISRHFLLRPESRGQPRAAPSKPLKRKG
jgi:hypothetical protein